MSAKTSEVLNYFRNDFVFLSVLPVGNNLQMLKIQVLSGGSEVFLFNFRPFSTTVDQNRQEVDAEYFQLLKLCDGPLKPEKRHDIVGQEKPDSIFEGHFINQGTIVAELAQRSENQHDHLKILFVVKHKK